MIDKDKMNEASKFANFFFQKTGLILHLQEISSEIENRLRGAYSEEDMDDVGNIFTNFYIINNGKLIYFLDQVLTNEQKNFCSLFCKDKNLKFSVCRQGDHHYVFTAHIDVPTLINTIQSPTFEVEFNMRSNLKGTKVFDIYGEAYDVSDEVIEKTHISYALKY
jgi:hypothetical protein